MTANYPMKQGYVSYLTKQNNILSRIPKAFYLYNLKNIFLNIFLLHIIVIVYFLILNVKEAY
jgi:hypothetical protein